jgi:hypothetical protein
MSEIWQTVFGKDVVGMAQGDNKTGQNGTNSIFVMTHDEIENRCGARLGGPNSDAI